MKITSLIFFIFPLFLSAQEIEKKKYRGSIDIIAGFDYCHYHENFTEFKSHNGLFRLNQWTFVNGGLGLRSGVNFNTRISEDFIFKLGANVNTHKLQHDDDFDFQTDASIKFLFLEFPVLIRREMEDRKLSPYLEFGAAPIFFVSSKEESSLASSSLEVLRDNINVLDFVLIISGGFNYNFAKLWDVYFQPAYRYHIVGIESSIDSKSHLYNIGLEVGLRYLL